MKKLIPLLILLALALPAMGQLATMDQVCTVRQALQSSGDSLAYPVNVVSGNLLVAHWHTRSITTGPTIADTRGSSWTLRITQGSGIFVIYTWTALAGGSGADTVTITETGGSIQRTTIEEFSTCPESIDATVAASSVAPVSGNLTMPNITTTAYRDFIIMIPWANTTGSRNDLSSGSYTYDIVSQYNATDAFTILTDFSGDPGTFTGPTIGASGGSTSIGMLAIKTSASLAVSTPAIPDAVQGVPYKFQLWAKGGAGTNTWTTTAGTLPCGLTLSSGGLISGTPTCSNANTITFQVTDSAAATATKNLTITVGTAASTMTFIQSHAGGGGSIVFSSNVTSGNMILVVTGSTTAFGTSEFATTKPTDTQGTVYSAIPGTFLSEEGSVIYATYYWGIAGGTGADTISYSPSVSSSWAGATEISNVQPIFDVGVVAKLTSNAGGAPTSGTISLPTTETLFGFVWPGTSTAVLSAGSGFTGSLAQAAGGNGGQFVSLDEYKIGVAQGSQSATWGISGNTSNIWSTMLMGLRPKVTGLAPTGGTRHKATQSKNGDDEWQTSTPRSAM